METFDRITATLLNIIFSIIFLVIMGWVVWQVTSSMSIYLAIMGVLTVGALMHLSNEIDELE